MDFLNPNKDPDGYDLLRKAITNEVKQMDIHTNPSQQTVKLFKNMEERQKNIEEQIGSIKTDIAVLSANFKNMDKNFNEMVIIIKEIAACKASDEEVAKMSIELKVLNNFRQNIKGVLWAMNVFWIFSTAVIGIYLTIK